MHNSAMTKTPGICVKKFAVVYADIEYHPFADSRSKTARSWMTVLHQHECVASNTNVLSFSLFNTVPLHPLNHNTKQKPTILTLSYERKIIGYFLPQCLCCIKHECFVRADRQECELALSTLWFVLVREFRLRAV